MKDIFYKILFVALTSLMLSGIGLFALHTMVVRGLI
jgi:hypothetical protein|tara:strand:- start:398 stop:505 length:108 start_codon:yes stop_codon:yes gene_type:complete